MVNTVRQIFSLPPDMLATLKAEATRRDLTLSQIVRERNPAGPTKGIMFGFLNRLTQRQPEPEPEPEPTREPRRTVAFQIKCPTCQLWQAPPGRNPGLIAQACMCDAKREALR